MKLWQVKHVLTIAVYLAHDCYYKGILQSFKCLYLLFGVFFVCFSLVVFILEMTEQDSSSSCWLASSVYCSPCHSPFLSPSKLSLARIVEKMVVEVIEVSKQVLSIIFSFYSLLCLHLLTTSFIQEQVMLLVTPSS